MKKRSAIFLVGLLGLALATGYIMTELRAQAWTDDAIEALSKSEQTVVSSRLNGTQARVWNRGASEWSRTLQIQFLEQKGSSSPRALVPEESEDRNWSYAWIQGQQEERLLRIGRDAYLLSKSGTNVRAYRFDTAVLPKPTLTLGMHVLGIIGLIFLDDLGEDPKKSKRGSLRRWGVRSDLARCDSVHIHVGG